LKIIRHIPIAEREQVKSLHKAYDGFSTHIEKVIDCPYLYLIRLDVSDTEVIRVFGCPGFDVIAMQGYARISVVTHRFRQMSNLLTLDKTWGFIEGTKVQGYLNILEADTTHLGSVFVIDHILELRLDVPYVTDGEHRLVAWGLTSVPEHSREKLDVYFGSSRDSPAIEQWWNSLER